MIRIKLIVFISLLLLLTSWAASPVNAQTSKDTGTVILDKDQVVDHDYFAGGGSVTVHGTVNGDAYLFGGNIYLDGTINGDLIVIGGTVTVGGTVKNDLRLAGGTVVVDGKIGGNILAGGGTITFSQNSNLSGSLIAGGGTVTVNTPISKNVWLGGGQTDINSNLKADTNIGGGEIILDSNAKIDGNLNYWSDQKIKSVQGSTVSGTVTQHLTDRKNGKELLAFASGLGFFAKIISTLTLLILGFLILRFLPKTLLAVSKELESKPLASLGWGAALLIIGSIASLILVISLVGLPLGLILGMVVIFEAFIAEIFVGFWLGRRLFTGFDKPKLYGWALLFGVLIFQIIIMLPFIGWLIHLLSVLVGVGALLRVKKATYADLKAKL